MVLEVWDDDCCRDDRLGTYTFRLTRDHIDRGELRVTFGRVRELRLVIKSR